MWLCDDAEVTQQSDRSEAVGAALDQELLVWGAVEEDAPQLLLTCGAQGETAPSRGAPLGRLPQPCLGQGMLGQHHPGAAREPALGSTVLLLLLLSHWCTEEGRELVFPLLSQGRAKGNECQRFPREGWCLGPAGPSASPGLGTTRWLEGDQSPQGKGSKHWALLFLLCCLGRAGAWLLPISLHSSIPSSQVSLAPVGDSATCAVMEPSLAGSTWVLCLEQSPGWLLLNQQQLCK